ncbi:hypothetical protein CA13_03800 [Planctomycetes bacterium CA13]|uniref:Uncharacterized protein n=1 Tax=Novipirellula herctigrandis TaxID=2527986 RepID=A0A5C5YWQ5_9BACT|nr:hypothetical protein CA13_03800 [Planctomycetes bacterium CA13]
MATSNVRNIDSLVALHSGVVRFAADMDKTLQEIRSYVHRTQEYFTSTQPAYWRHESELAERELNEARDNLANKRAAVRAADRPAATEAAARVKKAERRVRLCDEKRRAIRSVAAEVSKACDDLFGPLADVGNHSETVLPEAARELSSLIHQLRLYAEEAKQSD